jgi:hypothetical protein
MKGNSSKAKGPKPSQTTKLITSDKVMIRTDLGDKTSRYCGPNSAGEVLVEGACPTTKIGLTQQAVWSNGALPDRDQSGNALAVG